MSKNLVIVESPSKAKTIGKFLGRNYTVKASVGHVRDLPKSKLGVDVENNFEPQYITIRGKGSVVNEIKKEAKKADKIFLATDPDREGEAISWHLAHLLGLDSTQPIRIEFNEITKEAIQKAIKKPRPINLSLVDAQQARRILDRLVGYKISPILWIKIRKGLSAGRVQSVATRIVCDREKEIEDFVPQEYWNLELICQSQDKKKPVTFKYYGCLDKKVELQTQAQVEKILSIIEGKDLQIDALRTKERSKKAPSPFITSTLQQAASTYLNFATRKTMLTAQQLYEGIEVKGSGVLGLITYMRTDSVRISEEAQDSAKQYILQHYGPSYYQPYKAQEKKAKKVQDAHECIRPSYIDKTPEMLQGLLSRDQYRLYKLIWERFMASQMTQAVYETSSAQGSIDQEQFRASGSRLMFDGYTKIYHYSVQEETFLPEMEEGQRLPVKKTEHTQHFTQPPSRFTEASLVKSLEELGIGRPSTYAPTINTILAREYVKKQGQTLHPTELGRIVTDLMRENFKEIVDVDFTASMEEKLDEVEEGSLQWQEIIAQMYPPLEASVERANEKIEKIVMEETTDEICEECGSNMVVRFGRFGKFLACGHYPECKFTKPLLEKIGVQCPLCQEGEAIVRKSKKGRTFYGCSRFPACKFVSWDAPTGERCPKCETGFLVKSAKKGQEVIKCSEKTCNYQKD